MIKSYLLNNLFVPLRQISPSMLFASAALHSALFVVPIPSDSTNGELIKSSNSLEEDTTEVSKNICDEDDSLGDGAGEDSLGDDAALTEGAGEDSLDEDAALTEGVGEDSLDEDAALTEGAGEDSLDEDAALTEGAGEDSLDDDAALTEGAGEDSLDDDAALTEGAEEDSLDEDAALTEGAGEDSLDEDAALTEGAEEDSLNEEIGEEGNTTSSLDKEQCEDDSLPKGKGVKVPKETPLLSDLENGDAGEEIGDAEDANPDLASVDSGDSLDDLGDSTDEIPTPTEDFSAEGDDTSSEELSIPSEPESEAEIAFTPSEPLEDSPEDLVSEPVDEPTDDTVSETVDEPIDDTVSEPVDEPTDDTVSETIDKPEEVTETPSETNNQPQPRRVDPFAEFPNYSNVKPNFCGVKSAKIDRRTRRTSDSLGSVQAYFEKKLAGTDFQVEKLTDRPDTKVYQVSKGNLTQFLQLFAVEKEGTMILLSSQRVDCYRLSNESQLEKPNSKTEEQAFDATFQSLYAQLGWTEEKDFAKNSEVEKIFGKDTNKNPEELALLVKTKLESEGFEASQVNEEQSELLYEVKKGEFTKYISFVPTKEGKGAIILALKNSP